MSLTDSVVERKPRHGQEVSRSMTFCFPIVPVLLPDLGLFASRGLAFASRYFFLAQNNWF